MYYLFFLCFIFVFFKDTAAENCKDFKIMFRSVDCKTALICEFCEKYKNSPIINGVDVNAICGWYPQVFFPKESAEENYEKIVKISRRPPGSAQQQKAYDEIKKMTEKCEKCLFDGEYR